MIRKINRSQVPLHHITWAQVMRACPTRSEEALWRALRCKQLGVAVRCQVPMGRFILDFLAPAARLAVEVDGRSHLHRRGADARKERALRRAGYRLLRLDAELVLRDLPGALALIRGALARQNNAGG